MTKPIEFFFAIGSPYVYLALNPLAELSRRYGAPLIPRPTVMIPENGGIFSKDRPEPRRRYWLREIDRWAALRGKTLKMTERGHLSDPTPAANMVVAAALDGQDWFKLTDTLMQRFWSDERADIGKAEVRGALATAAGFDGPALLARERDADVQARWEQNRSDAKALGVFGFPTCVYAGELYWGQDNLDFLDRHLKGEPVAL